MEDITYIHRGGGERERERERVEERSGRTDDDGGETHPTRTSLNSPRSNPNDGDMRANASMGNPTFVARQHP